MTELVLPRLEVPQLRLPRSYRRPSKDDVLRAMNNGLLGWPLARNVLHPSLTGWPPQRRQYRFPVAPDLAGATGTNQLVGSGAGADEYKGNFPPELAVGDLLLGTCRFTASAASVTSPSDWTTIHTGNNTGGYWSAWKFADAADVAAGAMVNPIVRAAGDQANFLIVRFPGAGTPLLGTPHTGSGATPVMNGYPGGNTGMGDIAACGVSIGSCENARVLSDWVAPTMIPSGRSGVWSDLTTQVNGSQVAYMAFLKNDNNGPFAGWASWQSAATWTNFNQCAVWIPPQRARTSWQR